MALETVLIISSLCTINDPHEAHNHFFFLFYSSSVVPLEMYFSREKRLLVTLDN